MKTIFDYAKTNTEQIIANFSRVDAFIHSPIFLEGLGKSAHLLNYDDSYLVTGSILECAYLTQTQDMMFDDEDPCTHLQFINQCSESLTSLQNQSSFHHYELHNDIIKYLDNELAAKLQMYEVLRNYNLIEVNADLGAQAEDLHLAIAMLFDGYLYELIEIIFMAATLSDFHKHHFWIRLCEFFEVGGLPCGFSGSVGVESGADPLKCMIMHHRNTRGRPREILYPGLKN